jgi:hypothetical protein
MTPKEKAEDLLYQMRYDHMSGTVTKRKAKRCAFIAVDEILDTIKWCIGDSQVGYWEDVKKEIELL